VGQIRLSFKNQISDLKQLMHPVVKMNSHFISFTGRNFNEVFRLFIEAGLNKKMDLMAVLKKKQEICSIKLKYLSIILEDLG
jgi:hypothetical protein